VSSVPARTRAVLEGLMTADEISTLLLAEGELADPRKLMRETAAAVYGVAGSSARITRRDFSVLAARLDREQLRVRPGMEPGEVWDMMKAQEAVASVALHVVDDPPEAKRQAIGRNHGNRNGPLDAH